jgi:hypothetical protein
VTTLRHLGPVGLAADQEAIVSLANPTNAPVTALVTLFDANGQVPARQPLTVAPRQGGIVRWPAPGATQVRATVTTPGVLARRYPVEVRGPAGTPFLLSNEIVDEATGKTIAVLLGH